jgi:hypothetical protein
VGVVDTDHEPPFSASACQLLCDLMEKLQSTGGGRKSVGKKVREGTERNRSPGAGGNDPCRSGSLLLGSTKRLPCQTGLSHTRGAGKDDAALPGGDRLGQIAEFRIPAEQRPALRRRLDRSPQRSPLELELDGATARQNLRYLA